MNENELLVTEEVTENVETTTTEEIVEEPKLYTEKEFNARLDAMIGEKLSRQKRKLEKEYNKKLEKYSDLEGVLKAGTGKTDVAEMTSTFRDFYSQKGIEIPEKPTYSDRDNEILARAEAEEIIKFGFDDVVEEVDRLTAKGYENMSSREKAVFKVLAEYRQDEEWKRELSSVGISREDIESQELKEFAKKHNIKTINQDVYKLFKQTAKPKAEPIGSMKNGSHEDEKTFYTPEEVDRLTEKDYDNPVIMQRVRESMKKW